MDNSSASKSNQAVKTPSLKNKTHLRKEQWQRFYVTGNTKEKETLLMEILKTATSMSEVLRVYKHSKSGSKVEKAALKLIAEFNTQNPFPVC